MTSNDKFTYHGGLYSAFNWLGFCFSRHCVVDFADHGQGITAMADKNAIKLDDLLKRMRAAFNELPDRLYLDIGRYIAARIVFKARTGKTAVSGKESKLPPLSDGYVKQREARKKAGDSSLDSDFFSPRRSNLTLTGQYLKSIALVKFDRVKKLLQIRPTGRRKEGLSNEKLSEYLAKQGRSIFGVDETGRRVVSNMVKNEIRKSIRKRLLRK